MARQKGNTIESQEKRLLALDEILDKYRKEKKKPSNDEILQELKKQGFEISYRTLMRDLADAASNNTFVRDLANKTYSKIMEDCYDSLLFVEAEAKKILEKKWTRSTIVTKTLANGTVEKTTTATQELADPKLKALELISANSERISKMISGDAIKTSAASWISQRKLDKQTMEAQNLKIKELEAKLAKKSS